MSQSCVPPKCSGAGEARGHESGKQLGGMELAPGWGSGPQGDVPTLVTLSTSLLPKTVCFSIHKREENGGD